jgi:hypothetical protein
VPYRLELDKLQNGGQNDSGSRAMGAVEPNGSRI